MTKFAYVPAPTRYAQGMYLLVRRHLNDIFRMSAGTVDVPAACCAPMLDGDRRSEFCSDRVNAATATQEDSWRTTRGVEYGEGVEEYVFRTNELEIRQNTHPTKEAPMVAVPPTRKFSLLWTMGLSAPPPPPAAAAAAGMAPHLNQQIWDNGAHVHE